MTSRVSIDWHARQRSYRKALTVPLLKKLAHSLGVSVRSLQQLSIGWSTRDKAWTFPERDHQRHIVGILRRYTDGDKKVIRGGKRGLYIPRGWEDIPGPVFVPEGASDVAALLSRGLCVVGRPACQGGVAELAGLFADTDKTIVILGENDQKPDGRWPGRDGAEKVATQLAALLGREVRWTLPPTGHKDVREMTRKEKKTS